MEIRRSGKEAALYDVTYGTEVEGDGLTALTADTFYKISGKAATGSVLPYEVDYIFKTPATGTDITPIVGDNVLPVTLDKICKADLEISNEKGTIEVTDDCDDGYVSSIVDGFSNASGSINAMFRFDEQNGGLNANQEKFLNAFYAICKDDGAGVYSLEELSDADLMIFVLMNTPAALGDVRVWLFMPIILSGLTMNKPLKGVQNLDSSWTKGQGPAQIYLRTATVDL